MEAMEHPAVIIRRDRQALVGKCVECGRPDTHRPVPLEVDTGRCRFCCGLCEWECPQCSRTYDYKDLPCECECGERPPTGW